ncbi:ABC transporter ATP-binding protein [bacterium]|nr:ABC transporter ATP-binding protein [bacterium]
MIKVENMYYTYPDGSEPALHDINFQVRTGEIVGFLGPSGAGKSTTQKILIRLLKNYKGSVQIWDKEVSTLDRQAACKIGVAFEVPRFYTKLTARENLAFFGGLYPGPLENAGDLLKSVGLSGDLDTRISAFSKGMRMRLNFCRAVQHNPELLFLDEPTAGLDPVYAQRIEQLILQRREAGVTVFLTTHNMHVAQNLCDRVAFIVDGCLTLIDTPRNLNLQYGRRSLTVEHLSNGQIEAAEYNLDGLHSNKTFQSILKTGNIETMHTQEASLEVVFHKVTGSRLT